MPQPWCKIHKITWENLGLCILAGIKGAEPLLEYRKTLESIPHKMLPGAALVRASEKSRTNCLMYFAGGAGLVEAIHYV